MRSRLTRFRSIPAKLTAIMMLLAFSLAVMIPVDAAAQNSPTQNSTSSSVLVTGTTATGAVFNGVLKVASVAANSVTGALTASGTLTGTLTSATGQVLGTVNQAVSGIPVTGISGSCTILTLTLGPLDLDLLGLMFHLNQAVLAITVQPGSGTLLGNQLCSVANLLNGGSTSNLLMQLVGLVNQILTSL
jgi:hypothetical protein